MSVPGYRGNALPETAVTISTVMLVFLGVIRLALIGYQQSEADGAAFVAAHAASLRASQSAQVTDGSAHAKIDFPRVAASISPGSPGSGPYSNGVVAGRTDVFAQALFGPSLVDLHSQVREPVVGAATTTTNDNIVFSKTTLINCTKNQNPATPACEDAYLARPDPKNTTDPYAMYTCHQQYYATLTSGTNGTVVGSATWPPTWNPNNRGSINDPVVRAGGVHLNRDGTLGTVLRPIANFGKPGEPCALTATPAPSPTPTPNCDNGDGDCQ